MIEPHDIAERKPVRLAKLTYEAQRQQRPG